MMTVTQKRTLRMMNRVRMSECINVGIEFNLLTPNENNNVCGSYLWIVELGIQ